MPNLVNKPEAFSPGTIEIYTTVDNSDTPIQDKEFVFHESIPVFNTVAFQESMKRLKFEIIAFLVVDEPTREDVVFFAPDLTNIPVH